MKHRSAPSPISKTAPPGGEALNANDELFLLKLRYKSGRLINVEGRQPIALSDAQTAWVVYTGRLDVFAVPLAGGEAAGIRRHLLRAEAGQVVLGLGVESEFPVDGEPSAQPVTFVAVGGPETRVVQVPRARLEELALEPEFSIHVIRMLEVWVQGLAQALAVNLPPKESYQVQSGDHVFEAQRPARALRGVVWVEPQDGSFSWLGVPALPVPATGFSPLAGPLWLRALEPGQLRAVDTADFCTHDPAWSGLAHFHATVRAAMALRLEQIAHTDAQHLQERADLNREQVAQALSRLAGVMEPATPALPPGGPIDAGKALFSVCQLVGQALGVPMQLPPVKLEEPPSAGAKAANTDLLADIARASRLRVRQVTLPEHWQHTPSGPLLAYRLDGAPVALLPCRPKGFAVVGGYDLIDPRTAARLPVTAEVAADLAPVAHIFYRPLPERVLTALDLFRLGFRDARAELLTVALSGAAIGLLGLATPLMVGVLFNTIIPSAARGQLGQLGLVLLACALSTALFLLTQNITLLRLEGKWDSAVLPALWDRLLRLPPAFFRRGSSGDLAERAMGIDVIRRGLSGATISALLATPTALFSLGLLFHYDSRAAWISLGLALLLGAATLVTWQLGLRYQRQLTEQQGRIAGLVLEFATGIAKLRVAGAEARAFARWAQAFSEQRALAFRSRNAANGLVVFNAAYPLLATLAIFAMIAWGNPGGARLSAGDFVAFNAAFGQFLFTGLTLSAALLATLQVIPLYERARPILQELPEVAALQADPGELRGEIEVSHVVFRYRAEEPPVLKDISLQVQPGEFIALVGPSGCGKSTLMRLLLGFERPSAGAIYYDGQDLLGLDVERVRRQIGVVLQSSQLLTGNILSNIIGSLPLSIEDAWEAVRLVGLDEDLSAMPMGMHTLVGNNSSTLSGGQRQRLLIARAIVSKPRILFFDEATSALDNRSQALVSASLERLQATRIVVAHRLSTIINADRIFVMEEGRIVQSGTYAELIRQRGLFEDLVRRQML
ncbi:MAG: NHLP bacteriocin export ABC transporter permease/ATPase subunit [Anaerolineae bacterium]|nr:NHLP bacteriocin export ABC transporter permease/ATPase subunit [Anaerolineae bacterium]